VLELVFDHATQRLDEGAMRIRVVPSEVPQMTGEPPLHGP